MPASDPQRYAAALNAVALRYGRMEDATVRAIWQMLRTMRDEIVGQLAAAQDWNAYQLRNVQDAVDRYLVGFDAQAAGTLRGALGSAYQFGADSVVDPLDAIGLDMGFGVPSPQLLNAIVDASADLVVGITDEVRRFINLQIRQAALGQIDSIQAMRAIGQKFGLLNLRPGRETVKGIAYNAERIVRTELGRSYNLATHSQQIAVAERVPELLKKWVATGDNRTRQSHLVAHMRYMDNPIPISEPFEVGGSRLMYPMDPSGEAKEVINCRCRSVSVHPRVGLLPLKTDDKIRAELELRKQAAQAAEAILRQRVTPATQLGVLVLERRIAECDAALRVRV